MEKIADILVRRDGLSKQEADKRVKEARLELLKRVEEGEMPMDFCEEEFGLEPDYLDELLLGLI